MLDTGGEVRLDQALGVAYRYLNRRERTDAEVRAHLQSKGVEAPMIERAMEALLEQGLVDDSRYAQLFAQDKRELEDWGSERIRRTLRARGVERELIDAALQADAGESELERALAVLRRRFPCPVKGGRERERALGVLLRKGYDSELALEALARHGDSDPADPDAYNADPGDPSPDHDW
jgi:regulatory protein